MRFLFVDRILQLSPGKLARGLKHITRDEAYLCPDEQGRLCFIPSLIGETLGQLAAWSVMAANNFTLRPVAGVVSRACLHRPAFLGETLLLESVIESLDDEAVQYHSIATVGIETVFTIEGALGPLLPMNDFIATDLVRRQFNEINRPGDWLQSMPIELDMELDFNLNPVAAPMQFDRVIESEPGLSLTAEKRISGGASFFPDHFPNKPVLPLTVLLESKLNLAKLFLTLAQFKENFKVSEFRKIKMSEFVYPGDVVISKLKVKEHNSQQLVLSYRSEVEGKRVCVLEIVLIAKGENNEK
ncbi:MAG: hydroxymyristoyl-ACP dehydratase [Tatlockia sp.]|nr:hydroxymyristoyl-ACP dehydratase [Tatlockia sp.]